MVVLKRFIKDRNEEVSYYMDRYTLHLLRNFYYAVVKDRQSVVIVIDGKSGKGKTTLANQIGACLSKDYGLDCLHYSTDSFIEGLKSIPKGSKGKVIVFDEAMVLSSRSAMTRDNVNVVKAMSMIRSKNLFVIFCVNSLFDLDRNLILSRADILFHVFGDSLIDRGKYTTYFRAKGQEDKLQKLYIVGKKYYSYKGVKPNYKSQFPREFVLDENVYEENKQIFVNKHLDQQLKGGRMNTLEIKYRNALVRVYNFCKDNRIFDQKNFCKVSGVGRKVFAEQGAKLKEDDEYTIPDDVKWNAG